MRKLWQDCEELYVFLCDSAENKLQGAFQIPKFIKTLQTTHRIQSFIKTEDV